MFIRDWWINERLHGITVTPLPVRSISAALTLGELRNQCLDGLTGVPKLVTPEEQEKWYCSWKPLEHLAYIYHDRGVRVGWSHILFKDGFAWPSLGVIPSERRKGFGPQIVKHAMIAGGCEALGLLLARNTAIHKIDFALGWEKVDEHWDDTINEMVFTVRYPWPPKFLLEG